MTRPLRADHTPTNEPPWLGKAMNMLPNVEDNYLDALNIDLHGQFEEYFLRAGETFEVNQRYARDLEAQLPMPKERLRLARRLNFPEKHTNRQCPLRCHGFHIADVAYS